MPEKENTVMQPYPEGYHSIECPYCGQDVWGIPSDIDSGLRKHIQNYCAGPNPTQKEWWEE
jgi:hypothetical protein